MANERTVELLTSHRTRIARALVRQIRALSERYATIDPQALEMSLARILNVVTLMLKTGDQTVLKAAVLNTAQLRQALGFRVDDFMAAGLAFLPVCRRFILDHARTLEEGIEDYEAFEAIGIPLLSELARVFRHAGKNDVRGAPYASISDDDDLGEDDITVPNGQRSLSVLPFMIERVTGNESDESVLPS